MSAAAVRESFDRDGYVVFDPGIRPETIDAAVAGLDGQFRAEGSAERAVRRAKRLVLGRRRAVSHRDEVRLQDAWTVSEEVKAIATAPRVLELLRELYGRQPLPFQTLNFKRGSQQRPHSDAMHFNSEPSGFMCGVWVALEDIDETSGPLVYYPGSQRLDELTRGDVVAATGDFDYEAFVQSTIEREGLEARHATLRKGEALLWSSNLLHGGAPQRDPARTRWSQVTHYYFEGCRYWRPLASDHGGRRRYWSPTWVG